MALRPNNEDARLTLFTQLVRGSIRQTFQEYPEDVIVMAFHIRDIRQGKGERDFFQDMMKVILSENPSLAPRLIPLIPSYGRWDDVWKLYGVSEDVNLVIDDVVLQQFNLDQESESPSLLAKWLPREGKPMAKHFADLLFPLVSSKSGRRMRTYRKTLACLNRILGTLEIKMCGGEWADILPESVPGQLLRRNRSAFMNLKGKHSNEDRVTCADNFRAYYDTLTRQKTAKDKHVIEEELDKYLDGLIIMCDLSPSIEGVPKDKSMRLGVLSSKNFNNQVLVLDSPPRWHKLDEESTFTQKMCVLDSLRDLNASVNLLDACMHVMSGISGMSVMPVIHAFFVITDHNISSPSSEWSEKYKKLDKPPMVVIWNVSAPYKGDYATPLIDGVVQLSGWSPSLFKILQNLPVMTPMDELRKILDSTRYDEVRKAI